MVHGGARKGAGRKKGSGAGEKRSQIRKTATRVEAAIEVLKSAEITPLAVLMECMTHSYNQWVDSKREDDDFKKAAATFAEKAAAFVHPKLAATELSGNKDKPLHMMAGILDGIAGTSRGLPGRREEGDEEPGKPALAS
jgi:hypothetical protein